jgi:aminocarboxymuconate-semialdehyde decarboxylase
MTIDVDVHAHLAPVNAEALVAIDGVEWDEASRCLNVDGRPLRITKLYEPKQLIRWMDGKGIRQAWISIPPPLYRQQLSEDSARHWSRYVNRQLLAIASASEGRLRALIHLPLEHPSLALNLYESHTEPEIAGCALAAGGHSRIVLSDGAYLPLWEKLNDEKSFVFFHPGTCHDKRLALFYLENLLGNPVETAIAATHLIMAGIPEKFPQIRFCLAHGGGAFPSIVGRLERGFTTDRPGVNVSVEHPMLAARRLWADGITHHPGALRLAEDIFGRDHILYGSDWPFPMGLSSSEPPPSQDPANLL